MTKYRFFIHFLISVRIIFLPSFHLVFPIVEIHPYQRLLVFNSLLTYCLFLFNHFSTKRPQIQVKQPQMQLFNLYTGFFSVKIFKKDKIGGLLMHKLLIVEDDKIQNIALKDGINKAYPSWIILSTRTYEEALNILLESLNQKNYFSMFLLDIQLEQKKGDMSGLVLAEQIRSHKLYF